MAPDKPPGIIGKLAGAVAKRDRLAALKARFESRDPQEIERALADLGLTCGDYTPAEPDDAILHHLLPEMLERLKFDGETAWEDMNFMQTLRKACYGCPTESATAVRSGSVGRRRKTTTTSSAPTPRSLTPWRARRNPHRHLPSPSRSGNSAMTGGSHLC